MLTCCKLPWNVITTRIGRLSCHICVVITWPSQMKSTIGHVHGSQLMSFKPSFDVYAWWLSWLENLDLYWFHTYHMTNKVRGVVEFWNHMFDRDQHFICILVVFLQIYVKSRRKSMGSHPLDPLFGICESQTRNPRDSQNSRSIATSNEHAFSKAKPEQYCEYISLGKGMRESINSWR